MASVSLLEELTRGHAETGAAQAAPPIKGFAWARVSTSIQEERGLSIPEQLKEIREYAGTRNIEITAEFAEAESAFQTRAKRSEFERMLARAKAERVCMILCGGPLG